MIQIHAIVNKAKKQNDKAKLRILNCSLDSCSLFQNRRCIATIFNQNCRYGKWTIQTSSTKRANSYQTQLSEFQQQRDKIGQVKGASRSLEFIGDYVWLPYTFIDVNNDLFERKSVFFHRVIIF